MINIKQRVAALIGDNIRSLKAYHVQDASNLIKLDAMENPYTLPSNLREQLAKQLANVAINRYPDPECRKLKDSIRELWQIPSELQILLGNGSDELIQLICLALGQSNVQVIAPEPTFVMYKIISQFCGLAYQAIPLKADFSLDEEALLDAVRAEPKSVVFLAYPNNPTGTLFNESAISEVIKLNQGLVVIDEAYYSFAQKTLIDQVQAFDNVLLMRTFSKMGMAGLRLGILLGKAAWLDELNKIRLPYNINSLTQIAAEVLLQNWSPIEEQMLSIIEQRAWLMDQMNQIEGVSVIPSHANFVLFQVADAAGCFQGLKQQGILIKALAGDLASYLRVTVGTEEENAKFIHALQQLM